MWYMVKQNEIYVLVRLNQRLKFSVTLCKVCILTYLHLECTYDLTTWYTIHQI